jgi:hypothetical protein
MLLGGWVFLITTTRGHHQLKSPREGASTKVTHLKYTMQGHSLREGTIRYCYCLNMRLIIAPTHSTTAPPLTQRPHTTPRCHPYHIAMSRHTAAPNTPIRTCTCDLNGDTNTAGDCRVPAWSEQGRGRRTVGPCCRRSFASSGTATVRTTSARMMGPCGRLRQFNLPFGRHLVSTGVAQHARMLPGGIWLVRRCTGVAQLARMLSGGTWLVRV